MKVQPTFDDVTAINRAIVGGSSTIISPGAIDSALARPFHTFDGNRLYPTIIRQAGALLEGCVAAHGFSDGNKRTAWITTKTFLIANGIPVRNAPAVLVADFVEGVAVHAFAGEDVAMWLADHLVETSSPR